MEGTRRTKRGTRRWLHVLIRLSLSLLHTISHSHYLTLSLLLFIHSYIKSIIHLKQEGLLCGGSCGSAMFGALAAARDFKMGKGKRVVVLLADSTRNYMVRLFSRSLFSLPSLSLFPLFLCSLSLSLPSLSLFSLPSLSLSHAVFLFSFP